MDARQFHPPHGLRWIDYRVERAIGAYRAETVRLFPAGKPAKRISAAEGLKGEEDVLDLGEPFGLCVIEKLQIAVVNVHPPSSRMFEQQHTFPGGTPS